MIIGIDFDDTLSNRRTVKKKLIEDSLGVKISYAEVDGRNAVGIIGKTYFSQIMDFLEKTREGIFAAEPFPYSLEILKRLSSEGYGMHLISASSEEKIGWIKEWLSTYKILPYFEGFWMSNNSGIETSKEKICREKNIGLLVDNERRHFTFSNPTLNRILFSPVEQISLPGLKIARNWKDIYEFVK